MQTPETVTNPFGRYFVSYRRTEALDVGPLVELLHEHGLPTWLDVNDLASEPTAEELRRAIADADTAGAILFMTKSVRDSQAIKVIEAPAILKRHAQGRGFFVTPVMRSDLTYAEVEELYGDGVGLADLSKWNITTIDAGSHSGRLAVVTRILAERLRRIDKHLRPDDPLALSLHTRVAPRAQLNTSLQLDWSHKFSPRHCTSVDWHERLMPALNTAADAIYRFGGGRAIVADGLLGIPAAIALGSAFSSTRGIPLQWRQIGSGHADLWSLDASDEAADLTIKSQVHDLNGTDMVLVLSVTADITSDVRAMLPGISPRVVVAAEVSPTHSLTAGQAAHIARAVVAAIRTSRAENQVTGTLHIFASAPVGLAVMIGQLLNTFQDVQTYEFEMGGSPRYTRAALIKID